MNTLRILIAGAGPTGLACALELCRHGFSPRIIDRKDKPSPLSRAIGINARSLDLLEPCGVTEKLFEEGIKVPAVYFHERGKPVARFPLDKIPHRFNFILSLPQDRTEHIMQRRLAEYGVLVEYGSALARVENPAKPVLTIAVGGKETREEFDILIAADGAHSFVRKSLGIPFDGYDYKNKWSIADFDSPDWPYDLRAFHGFIGRGGEISVALPIGPGRFRGVADREETLPCIPGRFTVSQIRRADSFVISVRQARSYQAGSVYLAGDAAHVHSPVGGRGMNLGIEDACDLARRIKEGGLTDYTAARHPAGRKVINVTERMVRVVTLRGPVSGFIRRSFMRMMANFPPLRGFMLRFVAGLK